MLLALALLAAAPVDHPRTYLLSLANLPVKAKERIESFAIETWSVEFKTVCRVPPGWSITAGNSASPVGTLSGEGSHGVTWFTGPNPKDLRNFVLITVGEPVRWRWIGSAKSGGEPPTFDGHVIVWDYKTDREAKLTAAHISLVPATHCPR